MAFLQETPQPFFRIPPIVVLLIALLLGIELSREFLWSGATDYIYGEYGFVPARYSPAFLAAHHIDPGSWIARAIPFVSYAFLHGGFTHVAANSVWLLAFGPVVARRYGSALFILFFLLCAIGGAVAHLVCAWGSFATAIGASAAIAGLMAAAFRMMGQYPLQQSSELAPLFSRRILVWSAIWVVINVLAGLTGLGAAPGAQIELIAWQAHIGGYFAGLLLAGPFDFLAKRLGLFPDELSRA